MTGPRAGAVVEVVEPAPDPGEVVVDVHRVGVCGTDVEFWTGEMAYLHSGHARFPMRLGHEWCGVVSSVAADVDSSWLGRRVTGDTMIGCGHCDRCRSGHHNVCADRVEIGIRGGRPGALAEQLAVPAAALRSLPDGVDDTAGALVEPGGNALRAVQAAGLAAGNRLLVIGTGAIGLLAAAFARADGAEVHLLGVSPGELAFAASLGFDGVWQAPRVPDLQWAAVIDASNAPTSPALALELVEPGGRVVCIGLAGTPSTLDTRSLVLKDVTAVGILAASQGLAGAIEHYADGRVDPRPLVADTLELSAAARVLSGERPPGTSGPPKLHIDPRR